MLALSKEVEALQGPVYTGGTGSLCEGRIEGRCDSLPVSTGGLNHSELSTLQVRMRIILYCTILAYTSNLLKFVNSQAILEALVACEGFRQGLTASSAIRKFCS